MLERVRYSHMNPLRPGLVKDLPVFKRFAWCGHGALFGRQGLKGKRIEEFLSQSGNDPARARKAYLRF